MVIKINANDAKQRLDKFLKKRFPKIPTSGVYKALRLKKIKVNNKKAEPNYLLQVGDEISVFLEEQLLNKTVDKQDFHLAPSKLNIVYEDDNVILINKPAGLLTHVDEENTVDTLANRLKKYLYEKKFWDDKDGTTFIPSLVNRLDRNTKGIVIGAKNAESLKILNQKIKDREIDKFYLCQVMGKFPKQEGILEDYLTKNEKLKKVTVSKKPLNEKSVRIITQYKLLSYDKEKNTSLLEIKLITGKTHQIRAHLAFYGFPIVGDSKYGTKDDDFAHQDLTSCKVIFNFKSDAGILNYLNKKEFKINPK